MIPVRFVLPVAVLLCLAPNGLAQSSRATESRPVEPDSFVARVDAFHAWFREHATEFADGFDKSSPQKVARIGETTGEAFHRWLPGISWQFGPGSAKGTHSLQISPSGHEEVWHLGKVWKQRAPRIARWEFCVGKQPEPVDGLSIAVQGKHFDWGRARAQTIVDAQAQRIRVRLHHPLFAKCEDALARQATYLMLDAALGEAKVETCVGGIKQEKDPIEGETVPLTELAARIDELMKASKWPHDRTPDQYVRIQARPPVGDGELPRTDIVSTRYRVAALDDHDAERVRKSVEFVGAMGAAYVFLRVDAGPYDSKKVLAKREELQKIVERALAAESLGTCVAASAGRKSCYFDLLLYEPTTAIAALKTEFAKSAGVAWVELHSFDPAKASEIVALKGHRPTGK